MKNQRASARPGTAFLADKRDFPHKPPQPSAAEQIIEAAQGAIDAHSTILVRLRGLAARLGEPDDLAKGEDQRPCRSGILGNIHDRVDTLGSQAGFASELLDVIERQI